MSSTKELFRAYLHSVYSSQVSFQEFITQEQHEAARRALGWPAKK